jgi:hypothetical protein
MSVALQEETARIRLKMASLRRHMHKDARRIAANTSQLLDWRDYVRQFPKALIGAGLLIGMVFGPGRKVERSVKLSQESIDELLSRHKPWTEPSPAPRSSATSAAARMVTGLALSGASILLRKTMENYFKGSTASDIKSAARQFGRN